MIMLAAVLAGCSGSEPPRHYVTIGRDAVAGMHVLETDGPAAVVEISDDELEPLSERMHRDYDRCGGFMVHDSLEDARAGIKPEVLIDYTLDRAATVRSALAGIDPAKLLGTITELSAMPNRYYQSTTGAAASAWLRDRWRSFTTRRDVKVELVDHGWAQKSVVMTIPGETRPDQVVVIGGHLDSIGPGGAKSTAPGADDDASGVATLTEVARVLLAQDYRPDRTLVFVAYAAEEVGLRGSQQIAKAMAPRTVGALQLDMTNFKGSDKDIWLMKDFTSPAQNLFVEQLIDTYVGATWGLDACGYACSDHASWYRQGVPASMPFESRMAQNNKAIHTRNDTLERSDNNVEHAVKFARLGTAYAIELAKGGFGGQGADASHGWRDLAIALGLGLAGLGAARKLAG